MTGRRDVWACVSCHISSGLVACPRCPRCGVRMSPATSPPTPLSSVTFVVLGTPATKGSTVSFVGDHGVVTKADCKGLAAWAQAVAWAAKWAHVPLAPGAVRLTLAFQFVRPKRHPARPHHVVKPDADKLARAVLDALTGVGYHDDAQVVTLHVTKVYGEDTRTTVHVEAL